MIVLTVTQVCVLLLFSSKKIFHFFKTIWCTFFLLQCCIFQIFFLSCCLSLFLVCSPLLFPSFSWTTGRFVFHCSLRGIDGSVFSLPQQQIVCAESRQSVTSQWTKEPPSRYSTHLQAGHMSRNALSYWLQICSQRGIFTVAKIVCYTWRKYRRAVTLLNL